jgi:GntR family transcriptional regulator
MFINAGARSVLLRGERQKFLTEEWPRVKATIERLGLKAEELVAANGHAPSDRAKAESGGVKPAANPSKTNPPEEER